MTLEGKVPVVTVCMPLYNKERFLAESIESVLQQEADFYWDIIIADDFSTDGSREIALDYARKYPDKIKVILQDKNKGVGGNSNDLFQAVRSKYTAYLDTDDVFTDYRKLQKQVDFLEQHPGIGMVYGKSTLMDQDGMPLRIRRWPKYRSGNVFKDIVLLRYLPQFSSALVRTSGIKRTLEWKENPGTDYYFMVKVAHDHRVHYMDEFFFCYRTNPQSITNTINDYLYSLIPPVLKHFESDHPQLIKRALKKVKVHYAAMLAEKKPNFKHLYLLLKRFEFSVWYAKQLVKTGVGILSRSKPRQISKVT